MAEIRLSGEGTLLWNPRTTDSGDHSSELRTKFKVDGHWTVDAKTGALVSLSLDNNSDRTGPGDGHEADGKERIHQAIRRA
jgi:hypothetical protein